MERCDGPSNFVYAWNVRHYCAYNSAMFDCWVCVGRGCCRRMRDTLIGGRDRNTVVGGLLLDGAIHQAAEGGAQTLFLEVAEDNNVARTLYHSRDLRQWAVDQITMSEKTAHRRRPLRCPEKLGSALFVILLNYLIYLLPAFLLLLR